MSRPVENGPLSLSVPWLAGGAREPTRRLTEEFFWEHDRPAKEGSG
jgi:hypothetical protein